MFDTSVDLTELKTRALANRLRRKKRLEGPRLHRFTHPAPRVGHFDRYPTLARNLSTQPRGDRDRSPRFYRIAHVHNQIQQRILELVPIRGNGGKPLSEFHHQFAPIIYGIFHQRFKIFDYPIYVKRFDVRRLLPREGKHPSGEGCRALGSKGGILQGPTDLRFAAGSDRIADTIQIHQNRRKQVIEIMGDTTRE